MTTFHRIFIFSVLVTCLALFKQTFPQAVKGQSMRMHSISLTRKNNAKSGPSIKPVIGFVNLNSYETADTEVKLAYDYLKALNGYIVEYLTTKDLAKQSGKTSRFSILWIHRQDTSDLSLSETNTKLIQTLKAYVENGGKLLLTQQAVHYINKLGFEPQMLQDSTKSCKDDGYGRRLGLHACREHPVFTGLNGGAYLLKPSTDLSVRITGFFGDRIPLKGRVVAVDWDYIFLREDSKLILEYTPGKGKVLAVGGYMNFSIPNINAAHLALFTENCFRYLLDVYKGQLESYWDYSKSEVKSCPAYPERDTPPAAGIPASNWIIQSHDLDLKHHSAAENFWDVAGERLLTMGYEKGGIEEIWAHPFMALRDYEVGIKFDYKDTIYWLGDERPEVVIDPAFFLREYKFPRAYLKELVVNDPEKPNGVVHYEYRGVYPAQLIIRFKSNMRWMWPYSDRVTGSICHSWDNDLNAITIQDQSGNLNVMIGGSRKPVSHFSGQFIGFGYQKKDSTFHGIPTDKIQMAGLLCYKLGMNDNLDVIFSATSEGYKKTYEQFNITRHDPEQVYFKAQQHSRAILSKSLMISTPDPNFNRGYRWAILAADRFFANTPDMGKALVAGYATTRHGWDGGHKVNGRPGYGWYFGRDAEWSSFAFLDCGDFSKVKSQLEFFNKYQDLTGKIFHEASSSGIIHYDAADATPLYIVLAGKYFRHTNDTAFLRKSWPNIKRAINFCFSTDTDNDHLIENTNVGHGWVEGGELYGSHSTIYMAGAWGAALKEASNMASFMNDIESGRYNWESEEQKKIINNDFWNDPLQFFAYGKNKDGSFRWEQTILPAVPIYFRMADREKSILVLKNIAGNVFTTNWGVRILREDSKWFKPAGYHYGSVWPLFSGWASLAEYITGIPVQGFSHLMNNLNVYKNWGLGFVEEVLNGAEYMPSGVCAHQCWSETMVLQPAIEGMVGLEVKAQEGKITLAPQLPPQWDSLSIQNLRMADHFVDFHFLRTKDINEYQFNLEQGEPVNIEFMPGFPAGTRFTKITIDGLDVPFTSFKSAASMTLLVSFKLKHTSKMVVTTDGGISVLPIIPDIKPGDPAEGIRILSTNLSGNNYQVEVEGKAGSSGTLEFWSNGQDFQHAENARYLGHIDQIYRFAVDFESSESKYVTKTVKVFVNYQK